MLEKYSDKDRIIFKGEFQTKLFEDIRKNSNKPDWYKNVLDVIGVRSIPYIYGLKKGEYRLGVGQLRALLNNFHFLDKSTIEKNIEKIETYEELRSRLGKAGGGVGGKRMFEMHPEKLRKQAKLGGRATLKKYGNEYFKNLAKENASKGGFASVEKSQPTEQMNKIMKENETLGLSLNKDFFVNYTLRCDKNLRNVDFVYFRNNEIIAVEEVTKIIPYRKQMFFRLLEIVELRKILPKQIQIIFTFKYEKNNYARYPVRIDPGIILELLGEGTIPIIDNKKSCRARVISKIINNRDISKYLT